MNSDNKESTPTSPDNNVDQSLPPLPDSCPISGLLGTRLSQMSDAELEAVTLKVRAARESGQILRSLLSAKKSGSSKSKTKKEPKKPDLSMLDL